MPPVYPDLWILRHGQTEWNVQERLQGHLDSPLTAKGLDQARAQAVILRRVMPGIADVWCSPSGRAWHTGQIALEGHDAEIVAEPALREIGMGRWQGMTPAEVRAAHPALDTGQDPHLWKFDAPGGETLAGMTARVQGVLNRLERPTVLITHGVTSRLLRCLVLGLPPEALSTLPGGQGVVHRVSGGQAEVLTA